MNSIFDGMSDGDTTSVETPFGEVVFQFDKGDPSVGINGGVFALELVVNGVTFDRDSLEKLQARKNVLGIDGKPTMVTTSLATELDQWVETQL